MEGREKMGFLDKPCIVIPWLSIILFWKKNFELKVLCQMILAKS